MLQLARPDINSTLQEKSIEKEANIGTSPQREAPRTRANINATLRRLNTQGVPIGLEANGDPLLKQSSLPDIMVK